MISTSSYASAQSGGSSTSSVGASFEKVPSKAEMDLANENLPAVDPKAAKVLLRDAFFPKPKKPEPSGEEGIEIVKMEDKYRTDFKTLPAEARELYVPLGDGGSTSKPTVTFDFDL